jgi:hypothetical protein
MTEFRDSLWVGGNFKLASGIRGTQNYPVKYLTKFTQFCDTTKQSTYVYDVKKEIEQVTLYPNPTTGIVTLQNGLSDAYTIKSVRVMNVSGRQVSVQLDRNDSGIQANFSGLSAAVYYVVCRFKSPEVAP